MFATGGQQEPAIQSNKRLQKRKGRKKYKRLLDRIGKIIAENWKEKQIDYWREIEKQHLKTLGENRKKARKIQERTKRLKYKREQEIIGRKKIKKPTGES